MIKVLGAREAETYVLNLLRSKGSMTTRDIESVARKEGKRCPDETVLFLTKLKSKGIIKGAISEEKRGWIWWV